MRITGIRVWRVELPLHEGRYSWSDGNFVEVFDTTVVAVDTDAGLTGWGEVCPLGAAYLPAYANGARAGIAELGPALIGLDPRELGAAQPGHGPALKGHPYVKSALDMACWDILGKAAGLPVCHAAGRPLRRRTSRSTAPSRRRRPRRWRPRSPATGPRATASSSSRSAARPRPTSPASAPARPCSQPGDVLVADANTGWTDARGRAGRATRCATSTSTSSSPAPPTRSA